MNENKGNHAAVNGLELYYEIHGEGDPLILLHGGVGAIEMFGEVLPLLAGRRRVIAVDLQAHGRTADIDRPMTFEAMAEDVAALIEHLGLGEADVMGYSLGGGVALRTAIQHPEVLRKLVLVSTPFKRDGWYPEVLAGMEQMGPAAAEPMKQTPMYQLYSSVAPRPEDWPVLLTKLGELLGQDYDWSEEVTAIEAHTKKAPSRPPSHIHQGAFMMGPSSGTERRTTAVVAKRITVPTRNESAAASTGPPTTWRSWGC
jgi:pimeloyl-ACP methyl ester carboxylesterase